MREAANDEMRIGAEDGVILLFSFVSITENERIQCKIINIEHFAVFNQRIFLMVSISKRYSLYITMKRNIKRIIKQYRQTQT